MAITLAELLVKVSTDITDYSKGLDDALAKAKEAESSFTAIGKGLSAALTVPLAGLGAAAMEAASQVKEATNIIRTSTGAVGEQLSGLQDNFKNVWKEVPDGAAATATAIGSLATRLGLVGKPLEEMSTQMLNLARLTHNEVGPLITDVTRAFGQWQIATEKQSEKLDYLFNVYRTTGTSIGDIAQSLTKFGPALQTLGFSFDQAAVLIGKFGKEGVNLESVLPGLRRELANFAKNGIDASAGFAAMIDKIRGAKTETEALGYAVKAFGTRSGPEMLRVIRDGRMDLDASAKAVRALKTGINETEEAGKTMSEQLTQGWHQINIALEPIGRVMNTAMKDAIISAQPLIAKLGDISKTFEEMDPAAQRTAVGIAGIAAAAAPAMLAVKGLALAFSPLASLGSGVMGGIQSLSHAIKDIYFQLSGGTTVLTQGETRLLAFARAAGIAGAAFAGFEVLKGLTDDIAFFGKSLENAFPDIDNLAAKMRAFASEVAEGLELGLSAAREELSGFWDVLTKTLAPVGASVTEVMTTVADSIDRVISQVFPSWKQALRDFAADTASFARTPAEVWKSIDFKQTAIDATGPIGALGAAFRSLGDAVEYFSGKYQSMDRTVETVSARVQKAILDQTHVSQQALEDLARQRGIDTRSPQDKATASNVDLSPLLGAYKSQIASVQELLEKQRNLNAEVTKAAAVFTEMQRLYDAGRVSAEALARAHDQLTSAIKAASASSTDWASVYTQIVDKQKLAKQEAEAAAVAYLRLVTFYGSGSKEAAAALDNLNSKLSAGKFAWSDIVKESGSYAVEVMKAGEATEKQMVAPLGEAFRTFQVGSESVRVFADAFNGPMAGGIQKTVQLIGETNQQVEMYVGSVAKGAGAWDQNAAAVGQVLQPLELLDGYLNGTIDSLTGARVETENLRDRMDDATEGARRFHHETASILDEFSNLEFKAGRITAIIGTFDLDKWTIRPKSSSLLPGLVVEPRVDYTLTGKDFSQYTKDYSKYQNTTGSTSDASATSEPTVTQTVYKQIDTTGIPEAIANLGDLIVGQFDRLLRFLSDGTDSLGSAMGSISRGVNYAIGASSDTLQQAMQYLTGQPSTSAWTVQQGARYVTGLEKPPNVGDMLGANGEPITWDDLTDDEKRMINRSLGIFPGDLVYPQAGLQSNIVYAPPSSEGPLETPEDLVKRVNDEWKAAADKAAEIGDRYRAAWNSWAAGGGFGHTAAPNPLDYLGTDWTAPGLEGPSDTDLARRFGLKDMSLLPSFDQYPFPTEYRVMKAVADEQKAFKAQVDAANDQFRAAWDDWLRNGGFGSNTPAPNKLDYGINGVLPNWNPPSGEGPSSDPNDPENLRQAALDWNMKQQMDAYQRSLWNPGGGDPSQPYSMPWTPVNLQQPTIDIHDNVFRSRDDAEYMGNLIRSAL